MAGWGGICTPTPAPTSKYHCSFLALLFESRTFRERQFNKGFGWRNKSISRTLTQFLVQTFKCKHYNLKWDHFGISAKGKSDTHCKIKDTLLNRDLKPAPGADLGGGCRGCSPPSPWDDLRFSNTTGILQKNSLRSKRFQSSSCAKVRAEAIKKKSFLLSSQLSRRTRAETFEAYETSSSKSQDQSDKQCVCYFWCL